MAAEAESSGHTRRVVLVGDPGVGKSRLAREAARYFARVLTGRCAAYGEGARYAPLVDVLRGALDRGDDVPEDLAPLLETGAPTAPSANVFRAVRLVLESAAPVLIVLDDVQWAASMLLDLVEYLVAWGGELPVALLCVARPELLEARRSWEADALILEPLGDDDAGALVRFLAPQDDEQRLDTVLRAAEGNPLFLEQLVAFEGETGELPPTIETLLASRLDRLSPDEREVLCHAAVVGPEFGERDRIAGAGRCTAGRSVATCVACAAAVPATRGRRRLRVSPRADSRRGVRVAPEGIACWAARVTGRGGSSRPTT